MATSTYAVGIPWWPRPSLSGASPGSEPRLVTVGLASTAPPPDPDRLAKVLARDMRRTIDLVIVFVPQEHVVAEAPDG